MSFLIFIPSLIIDDVAAVYGIETVHGQVSSRVDLLKPPILPLSPHTLLSVCLPLTHTHIFGYLDTKIHRGPRLSLPKH